MYVAKASRMANRTPFFGYKVDVLHDTPRKDDDQIGGHYNNGVLGESGDAHKLWFTTTFGHSCEVNIGLAKEKIDGSLMRRETLGKIRLLTRERPAGNIDEGNKFFVSPSDQPGGHF